MKHFSVLLLFLISFSSLAANYYVATTGNNSNAGGSTTPWATLQYAASRVVAGDTVTVSNGTYSPFYITQSGTAQNRITFVSPNKLGAIINGNVVNDGRSAGIHVTGNNITIDGFDVVASGSPATGAGERGIRASGSSGNFLENVILRNNRVTGAGWVGITTSFANNVVLEYKSTE